MGVQCVVYKATISAPNHAEKCYYGLSEPVFKRRYAYHKSSPKYPSKRNTTELSKYYSELRDEGVDKKDIKVDWRIERQAHKYRCGTRICDLCLTEKLVIALADKSTMVNKRSEIISACPHRTKYRYNKVTKVINEIVMCPGVMYPIQIVNTKCAFYAWYCYHVYHVINWLSKAILHVDYCTASALTSGMLQHNHYVLQDCHLLDYYYQKQPLLCNA